MKRTEHIINDIRFSTNQERTNRFPDIRFNKLLNDAQEEIQRVVYTSDNDSRFFSKESFIDSVGDQESYDLPVDIYSSNAINSVALLAGSSVQSNSYYTPIKIISEKERSTQSGYIVQGDKILISPIPSVSASSGIRVNYIKKLPDISFRLGKVASIVGPLITVSGFPSQDILDYDDYICSVDREGVQQDSGLYVSSYNNTTGEITIDTGSTPIVNTAVNDYIVIGKNATSHSELEDSLEPYLTLFVEKKIFYINSSKDIGNADIFTKEEKQDIIMLFSKIDTDVKYPAIVDGYLNH